MGTLSASSDHNSGETVLELTMKPSPWPLAALRRFISQLFTDQYQDPAFADRVALATHELMENAVKYGAGEPARLRIAGRHGPQGRSAEITISNQTSPEHSSRLVELLAKIERAPDPMALYVELMNQTATRTEGSGLGLARIRAEAEMRLSHQHHDGWVEVTATTFGAHS